jgi:hypothetical protein
VLESENVSAGVFSGDRLVGYQLWDRNADIDYDTQRFAKVTDVIASGRTLFNKGTVITPEWQKRGLARLLEQSTNKLARGEGYRYRLGQIFVSNKAAIRLFLAIDRSLIGLSTDEFGLNFVSCTYLESSLRYRRRGVCQIDEIDQIGGVLERFEIFESVGRGLAVDLIFGDATLGDESSDTI